MWAANEGSGHLLDPSCHGEGSVPRWALSPPGHWKRAWGWGRLEAQGPGWLVARGPCPSFAPVPPTSMGPWMTGFRQHVSRLQNDLLCRGESVPRKPGPTVSPLPQLPAWMTGGGGGGTASIRPWQWSGRGLGLGHWQVQTESSLYLELEVR